MGMTHLLMLAFAPITKLVGIPFLLQHSISWLQQSQYASLHSF